MENTVDNVCPLYTTTSPFHECFGGPFIAGTTPSPMLSLTPPSLYNYGLISEQQPMPYILPPLSVSPLQYFMCPGPATISPSMFMQGLMRAPVSMEGMSSHDTSLQVDDAIDDNSFKPEDPLHSVCHSVKERTQKRYQSTQFSNQAAEDHELIPVSAHTDDTASEIHDVLFKSTQCHDREVNEENDCVLSPLIDVVGLSDTERVQLENSVGMVELTGAQDVSVPVSDDYHMGNQERNSLIPKRATAQSFLSSPVEHTPNAETFITASRTALQTKASSQSVSLNSVSFDVLGKVNIATVGNHDQDTGATDLYTDSDSALMAVVN